MDKLCEIPRILQYLYQINIIHLLNDVQTKPAIIFICMMRSRKRRLKLRRTPPPQPHICQNQNVGSGCTLCAVPRHCTKVNSASTVQHEAHRGAPDGQIRSYLKQPMSDYILVLDTYAAATQIWFDLGCLDWRARAGCTRDRTKPGSGCGAMAQGA